MIPDPNREHPINFAEGEVILIDKPLGWTSFDVVAKVRNALRIKKVGHAGTLDPLATGLLILCTGKKTREIQAIQDSPKQYIAQMKLGATTATYDAEAPEENLLDADAICLEDLCAALPRFRGKISQTPPAYSAIKVDGKRAYQLARSGMPVALKAREVEIHKLEIIGYERPYADLTIECSKGTYIRSLVHDIGQALGVGAYMNRLVRTQIGAYCLTDAYSIPSFIDAFSKKSNQANP